MLCLLVVVKSISFWKQMLKYVSMFSHNQIDPHSAFGSVSYLSLQFAYIFWKSFWNPVIHKCQSHLRSKLSPCFYTWAIMSYLPVISHTAMKNTLLSSVIFLARNLHSVRGFSSQPCLISRGYYDYYIWLLFGWWFGTFFFLHLLGISSSQLTCICFRGV